MARPTATFCFAVLTLLLSSHLSSSLDPPSQPPSPAADAPASPPPQSDISSPPSPPPDASPATPPTPSASPTPTPSPSGPEADAPPPSPPSPAADDDSGTMNKSRGLSAGTKAGVAFGVIAFVALAALGAFVFKKRKDNAARAQYGSAARRGDML